MGKSFVYNTGFNEDVIERDELHLNFGVFIDGTLNNMYNTNSRTQHARGGLDNPDWNLTNKQIEDSDAERYKKLRNPEKIKNPNEYEKLENDKKERKAKDLKRIEELLGIENRTEAQQKELEGYDKEDVYLVASSRDFLDKQGTDNSYSNDYTNVARMWTCCGEEYKIYVEGMGTTKLDKDDQDGFAFGAGSKSGIRARVREACEKLADKIGKQKTNETNKLKTLTEITVDVFGFSRGAASARNFVAEINHNNGVYAATRVGEYEYNEPLGKAVNKNQKSPLQRKPSQQTEGLKGIDTRQLDFKVDTIKHTTTIPIYHDRDGKQVDTPHITNGYMPRFGHLGISLLTKDIVKDPEDLEEIKIIVRFLGIYDTVSSYGEIGELGGDWVKTKGIIHLKNSYFEDDEAELNLQNMGTVQQIVHFTAKDEHRENFALTRVDKKYAKKNEDGSDRLVEKNFPGVHCDIGGAYMSEPEIIDEIETTAFLTAKTALTPSGELKNIRQKLIDNYWFTDEQIKITITPWHYPLKVIELFSVNRYFASAYAIRQANYEALTSNRNMRKEYSFIPLHFMEEYFRPLIEENFMPDSVLDNYSISNLPVLVQAKAYLKKHVFEDNREWEFASDTELLAIKKSKNANFYEQHETAKDNIPSNKPNIDYEKDQAYANERQRIVEKEWKEYLEKRAVVREQGKYYAPDEETKSPPVYAWEKDYKDPVEDEQQPEPEIDHDAQALLRILRNKYFHWSANRDWLGMDQASSDIRVEYPKK
ncbi:phospholipase effector Tle1 domain-containing protein [Flavobacterium reichenbachii]|uniref:T6SS Phospholipase effector Tle1-like catalytic domain-containing protein n=1 Tax=Flavobacterium reichenbachii TaxID=362418 RepID=A0A085ZDT8_9FLAO|nr:DUF2235 domain-containing protein [Flavobacterium reichenbachii]KFF02602.1 hypothetical protein IW19_23315 [Flavobacterium reichenbachii]OXB17205.1 hypothetical protein B0A68_05285 [Flavobacterium reichenbachii]